MKVWLIEYCRYEDLEVVKVFDNEEKANAFVERQNNRIPMKDREWIAYIAQEFEVE